jgi:tol-pal system protein YbgF
MKLWRLLVILVIALPATLSAQKKEIAELQRDVAFLQQEIKNLQGSFNERTTMLQTLVQQALDQSKRATEIIIQVQERQRDQEKLVAAPVAGLGAKVDQMADEFRFVKESVTDLNARMSKLQAQLVDVSNAIKVLQAPPAPPPAAPPSGAAGCPPSSEQLYQNAYRDYTGGNSDLAMQEFSDFLRCFPTTDYASNAQFYVGMIHYNKGDAKEAIQAFDAVLEKYGDNNKTPDAMLMKGRALLKLSQRTAAAEEFLNLIKRFPNTDMAARAAAERKNLGYTTPPPKKSSVRKK